MEADYVPTPHHIAPEVYKRLLERLEYLSNLLPPKPERRRGRPPKVIPKEKENDA